MQKSDKQYILVVEFVVYRKHAVLQCTQKPSKYAELQEYIIHVSIVAEVFIFH